MSALPDAQRVASLTHLHSELWRADALSAAAQPVLASGHSELDALLPGGGWPVGALCEVLQPPGQHSEWRLLLPALARSGQGAVVLVGPALVPFAPALQAQGLVAQRLVWLRLEGHPAAQRLWAAEQALRCAGVDAVLLWLPGPPQGAQAAQLRRLHLAAVQHQSLFFALREHTAREQASAAVLRLALALGDAQPHCGGDVPLQVDILKRRGPPLTAPVVLAARPARQAVVLATGSAHALGCITAPV
jgi:protein ImuA